MLWLKTLSGKFDSNLYCDVFNHIFTTAKMDYYKRAYFEYI